MRRIRHVLFGVAGLLLTASTAEAHLVNTGLGPFYDGAMHVALSPDDWLGIFAAALLAGLCGAQASRWTLVALPVAWLGGAMAGRLVSGFPEWPGLSILSFVVIGMLVALDVKLPAWSVATLGGFFGLLHGLQNGAALRDAGAGMLDVVGIVTTVFVLSLLVSAAVVSLRSAWARVAVRVAGSWVVAVGTLMFGWLFRGTL